MTLTLIIRKIPSIESNYEGENWGGERVGVYHPPLLSPSSLPYGHFPIIGKMNYEGYEDYEDKHREEENLARAIGSGWGIPQEGRGGAVGGWGGRRKRGGRHGGHYAGRWQGREGVR